MADIKLEVGVEVIGAYKRLSYTPWYAFAEFVDNSTQAFFNNQKELEPVLKSKGERLTVTMNYNKATDNIRIWDNSIGMSSHELTAALHIGVPPSNDQGRSKYGLGLKTAACWFGDKFVLKTKRFGQSYSTQITFDASLIVSTKNMELPTLTEDAEVDDHYTEINISRLNRSFHGNTLNKVKTFLRAMYRIDMNEIGLLLEFNGDELHSIDPEKNLYITQEGKPFKQALDITIGHPPKRIYGWVGVLSKGGREEGGFSLIQNKRVIKGWPAAYKPKRLYGDQEYGSNDLINQRMLGELFLGNDFAVSHTKDSILWQDDEEEELEMKLENECADARMLALTLRFRDTPIDKLEAFKIEALTHFSRELKSDELRDRLFNESIPDDEAISLSNATLVKRVVAAEVPAIDISIGTDSDTIKVKVYLRATSEFEPYVTIEASTETNTLIVIINILHPYWKQLKSVEGFLDYIRHCVYDGIAEWRAAKKMGRISHDTVKYIKDMLLRLPYDIIRNTFTSFNQS